MPDLIAGRYALLTNIGTGASADVWQARDTVLQRDVAVKRFSAGYHMDETMTRELGALSSLDHPGIVRLYDAGVEDERPFLVVELVEGPTLKERLTYGPLTLEQARILGRDVAEALAHAHEHNLVHQDVAPNNILLEEGRARLTDFGICTPPRHECDASEVVTTSGYTAVEQLLGGPICPAADVHALGLVLLEALTGRKEFDGSPLAAAVARVRRQPTIPPNLPSPWPQLLSAMTARDPMKRPSAATVAAYLDAYQAMDLPPLDTPPTAQQAATEVRKPEVVGFVRRHPRVAVTAAAVLVGFALSWPLSAADPPQAEVIPGVMASEVPSDMLDTPEISN